MLRNWTQRIKFFFALSQFVVISTACAPRVSSPALFSTGTQTNATALRPSDTAIPLPAETHLPIGFSTTATPPIDERSESFLLPSQIDEKIAQMILLALETRLGQPVSRGERFFSYVLLQPIEQSEDGSIKAYLVVRDRAFFVEQGQLKDFGGGEIPVALTMMPAEDGWLVDVDTPIAGQWGSSIREIFPEEVWPLLFHSPPIPFEAMEADIVRQAEAHFGFDFDPQKNSFPTIEDTLTPVIRILTLTPTPTVDINALEPDVSGRAFVSNESISISVDLYPGVINPFQKGLLSAPWHIYLFPRGLETDMLMLDGRKNFSGNSGSEFYVEVTLEEVYQRFGDRRGFMYRITDETGEIFWQGDVYLGMDLSKTYVDQAHKDFSNDYPKDVIEGVVVGEPNLLTENVSPLYLPDEKFIIIKEPRGGFYSLSYQYHLAHALGITATDEIDLLSDRLVIELFPFREDRFYSGQEGEFLSGDILSISGILQVNFSHEWLDRVRDQGQKYYLRIGDLDGNIYKGTNLLFLPYSPTP